MPGVSTKTICERPTMAMPRTIERVVCTLRLTIDTLVPTSRLTSVDLPAFGAPRTATNPQRVASASGSIDSLPDAFADEHARRGILLGLAPAPPLAPNRIGQRRPGPRPRIAARGRGPTAPTIA